MVICRRDCPNLQFGHSPAQENPLTAPEHGQSDRFAGEGVLRRALALSWWAILWERLWPGIVSVLTAFGFFVAVSWMGIWIALPPLVRVIGLIGFALLIAISALPLFRLHWPSREDSLRRLDQRIGVLHRPATAVTDRLAVSREDQVSVALWQTHLDQARRAVHGLRVGWPRPGLAAHDPFALRALVLALLLVTLFAAGGERGIRLLAAFDWTGVVPPSNFRVDAWVTPPAYTARPPILLAGIRSGEVAHHADLLEVPAGSTLLIRATAGAGFEIAASGGLVEGADEVNAKPAAGTEERRFTIKGDGAATLRRTLHPDLTWVFRAIPDLPPKIALAKEPESELRGSLRLTYKLEDDYGVIGAQAIFARNPDKDASSSPRALFGPPDFALSLPQARTRSGIGQTSKDLAQHPWAGTDVVMTLVARDEAGNQGRSAPKELRLPERSFSNPLARALIEQRRTLALDANSRGRVLLAFDALTIAPERFVPETRIYLGLRAIYWHLDNARSDDDLRNVVARMWSMATAIEDGDASEAEQALRAAQDALREALERGASDEEIKRLTEELRAALDRFLQALTEQLKNNPQQLARPLDPNARVLRPQDLRSMLDRIENLARSGAKDAARQLLQELQSMLDNLQMARPGGQDDDTSALDELGDMLRQQQHLRDRTFRQGKDNPGQRQRGGRPNGQRQPGFGELQKNQEALRGQLKKLLEELRRRGELGESGQQGQNTEESLGRAEEAMRDAEGALGEENADAAVDAQGRAIEALRKGAQGFAQQMQQGNGRSPGQAGRTGPPRAQQDTDPLGRPLRGHGLGDDLTVKIPGEIDVQRARRILEELRRRFADPQRPQLELDYIERLLQQF
jgi:uncharacterized protein (TIGR02302 family)